MTTTAQTTLLTDAELEALMAAPAKPKLPKAVKVSAAKAEANRAEAAYKRARRPQSNDALTFLMNRAR